MSRGAHGLLGPPGRELFDFFAGAEAYSDVFSTITDPNPRCGRRVPDLGGSSASASVRNS